LFAFPLIVFETRDVLIARFNFRKIPRTKSRQNSPDPGRSGEVKSSDVTRLVRPLWDQFPGIAEKGVAVLAAEDHEMTRGGIVRNAGALAAWRRLCGVQLVPRRTRPSPCAVLRVAAACPAKKNHTFEVRIERRRWPVDQQRLLRRRLQHPRSPVVSPRVDWIHISQTAKH